MSLSRLFLAEKSVHLQKKGFPKPTTCFSPAPSSPRKSVKSSYSIKAPEKEQKVIAVESIVKKYMLVNPGILPTIKQVQDEVGGSWFFLNKILTELKKRMVADPYMQITKGKTGSTMEAVSNAVAREENPNGAKLNGAESRIQPSEVMADPHIHKEVVTSEKSHLTFKKPSEALAMVVDSVHAKLVELENRDRRLETHSSTVIGHERNQKTAYNQLSCMIRRIIGEDKDNKAPGIGSDPYDKSNVASAKNRDSLPDRNVNYCPAPNQSSIVEEIPTSSGKKITRLADLFRTRKSDDIADELTSMKNDTLKHDGSSYSKIAPADDFEWKQGANGLFDSMKKFPKEQRQFNRFNRGPRHENPQDFRLENIELLNSDDDQNTLSKAEIHDEIERAELEKEWVEPRDGSWLDLLVKGDEGKENKLNGHIVCDGSNLRTKVKEQVRSDVEMFYSQYISENQSGSDSDIAAPDYPNSE
ncbi:uncharacterized protein LOC143860939 [Tasmannia lanceolata]|uniref:uncharacterized protein LOC143860939 n=1 Tax=Tasmannia lanceolata TaxID=3420 RepID=UPI004063827D